MLLNNTKYSPYAWWLTSEKYINGDVAVLGALPVDDLYYLSNLSRNLYYSEYGGVFQDISNLNHLDQSVFIHSRYDAIVISQNYENKTSLHELKERLKPGGVLTEFRILNEGIFSRLINLIKYNSISNIFHKVNMINGDINYSLPCISYNRLPYEAFVRKKYNTNKNIHRLKEKVKKLLLNSAIGDLFINSYINIYYKNERKMFFERLIHESILSYMSDRLSFTKIYYKYGKLILSYVSEEDLSKYIVIMLLDESAVLQRRNEAKIIKYLKNLPSLMNYVVNNYFEFNYCGLDCVFMDEVVGITIDEFGNGFDKVTRNIFEVIKLIGLNTLDKKVAYEDKVNIINRYIFEFNIKLPGVLCFSSIDKEKSLETLNSLGMVTMHGDSKIENYVVDAKYNVLKIIDWELSEIRSFPFLDVIYFIVYNIQIENSVEFLVAFDMFYKNNIKKQYREMISDYLSELSITDDQRKFLMGVFLLHHYARRVVLTETLTDELYGQINGYLRSSLFVNEGIS